MDAGFQLDTAKPDFNVLCYIDERDTNTLSILIFYNNKNNIPYNYLQLVDTNEPITLDKGSNHLRRETDKL